MTTTVTSAPSSAATDASAGSSTAPGTAVDPAGPPQSIKERMLVKATATQAQPSAQVSPPAQDAKQGDAPEPSPGKAADVDDDDERSDEGNDVKKKKAPDSVPLAAFKARLAEEKSKRDAAMSEAHELRLKVSKYEAAVELLREELQQHKDARREGKAFNDVEEELAETRLGLKARELSEKLAAEHAERLKQINEEAAREERRLSIRTQIEEKTQQAVAKYDLVTPDEVYRYMEEVHRTTGRAPSAMESARLISEHKTEQLKKLGYVRPASTSSVQNPLTVSAPSGGANLGRSGSDRNSMAEFARAHLGHR
jgi:hypothetical protein